MVVLYLIGAGVIGFIIVKGLERRKSNMTTSFFTTEVFNWKTGKKHTVEQNYSSPYDVFHTCPDTGKTYYKREKGIGDGSDPKEWLGNDYIDSKGKFGMYMYRIILTDIKKEVNSELHDENWELKKEINQKYNQLATKSARISELEHKMEDIIGVEITRHKKMKEAIVFTTKTDKKQK